MAGEKDTKKGVKGLTIGKLKIQEHQPHHQRIEDTRGGKDTKEGVQVRESLVALEGVHPLSHPHLLQLQDSQV